MEYTWNPLIMPLKGSTSSFKKLPNSVHNGRERCFVWQLDITSWKCNLQGFIVLMMNSLELLVLTTYPMWETWFFNAELSRRSNETMPSIAHLHYSTRWAQRTSYHHVALKLQLNLGQKLHFESSSRSPIDRVLCHVRSKYVAWLRKLRDYLILAWIRKLKRLHVRACDSKQKFISLITKLPLHGAFFKVH